MNACARGLSLRLPNLQEGGQRGKFPVSLPLLLGAIVFVVQQVLIEDKFLVVTVVHLM